MWILWVMSSAQAAGCRGAIGEAMSAWGALAVPIPTETGALPGLTTALDTLTTHSAIAESLRAARTRKGRSELANALTSARQWLDANPEATGVDTTRAALQAAESARAVSP
jgi:hypothetical protein